MVNTEMKDVQNIKYYYLQERKYKQLCCFDSRLFFIFEMKMHWSYYTD
jgi:hypothetical protein